MNTRQCKGGGFTLIEALVALLVLAIGALGAGAMVLNARRAAQHATRLSAAVHLAARVGESMRANRAASALGDATNPYLQLDYDALADGPPEGGADCAAAVCDSAALAAADLAGLRRSVFDDYPLGRIKICRDGAWSIHARQLTWDCDGSTAGPVVVKIGWRTRHAANHDIDDSGQAAGNATVLVSLPLALAGVASSP